MFPRFVKFSPKHTFFLFGPRGTGKSTLLKKRFQSNQCLWLDLLESSVEEQFSRNPGDLYAIVRALPKEVLYVVVDEIQKVPKLLDEVPRLIEETDKIFILTGSSARKLKHGGANLLAGRAFVYHLYALPCFELGERFELERALHNNIWGSVEERTKGRGGKREGAGRPKGTKKPPTRRVSLPADVADWIERPSSIPQVREMIAKSRH
jgi:predicted AAA+ superfamily ATPase